MKYQLPSNRQKTSAVGALDLELYNIYDEIEAARKSGRAYRPRFVKIVFNPYSGKFRTIRTTSKIAKNELVILGRHPSDAILAKLRSRKGKMPSVWRAQKILDAEFGEGLWKAVQRLTGHNVYWNAYFLGAERLLEMANEKVAR